MTSTTMKRTVNDERRALLGLKGEPMGYVDGMNVYQLELDNPINHVDPTGMESEGGGPDFRVNADNIRNFFQPTSVKVVKTYIKGSVMWGTIHSTHAFVVAGKASYGFYAESHLVGKPGSSSDAEATLTKVPGYVSDDDFSTFPEGPNKCEEGQIYKVTYTVYIRKFYLGLPLNADYFAKAVEDKITQEYNAHHRGTGSPVPYNAIIANCDTFVDESLSWGIYVAKLAIENQFVGRPPDLDFATKVAMTLPDYGLPMYILQQDPEPMPYNPTPPLPAGVA